MPVHTSYPGIYIEELPGAARAITAAPTSNTVFIGYSHPFRTRPENWDKAVPVFSFAEYEREFGGLFRCAHLFSELPYAVQNFFLNGGAVAYIVALKPALEAPVVTSSGNITFTGLEPTDASFSLKVRISNLKQEDSKNFADLTITYGTQEGQGTRVETFRRVELGELETRINGTPAQPGSTLVKVSPGDAALPYSYPTEEEKTLDYPAQPAPASINAQAISQVFQEDSRLDKVEVINLMALPGIFEPSILSEALAFCQHKRAFLIMDARPDVSADGANGTLALEDALDDTPRDNPNGALYFPYLLSIDRLTGKQIQSPPSGFVAGIYARTDLNRGVWKAPAGLEATVNNTLGVVESGRMTDSRAGRLNDKAVNALRTFPGTGTVVFGARSVTATNPAFQQWMYVPVRRMALFIEQTLYANLGWAVFEPNAEPLWVAIRTSVEAFMMSLFRQGAFFGTRPSEAFLVKCDNTTTTQQDIDNGQVKLLVGFRPLKPAEFVIIQITQLAGQA